MDAVLVEKVKRPDGRGLWGAYVTGEDADGRWLFTPQGSTYRGTKDGVAATCTVGDPVPPGVPVVHLIPAEGWWFARWQVSPHGVSTLAIDLCTPSTFDGRRWEYVDLELDLFSSSDGLVGIFDEDEFDEAVAAGHITADERTVCRETATSLEARLRSHDELFDERGWARYREGVGLDLAPIVALDGVGVR